MGQEPALTRPQNLKLYEPDLSHYDQQPAQPAKTPNEWFGQKYPEQAEMYGSPFLELIEPLDQFSVQVLPILINIDFFAGVLGGRRDLGHHTIYYEPEMQFYFLDSDGLYKPTTPEKLANQYRALMIKCAEQMPPQVHTLNLFHEFRSDKTAKAVVNRAKSILAADHTFFSATSPHQRIRGIELHERLARKFVDELLSAESGHILMLHDAYTAFCNLLKQRELEPLKRSVFKAMVVPLIRDEFNIALRNDLVVDGRQGVRGWKNVKLSQTVPN
jgi:hypothetical protein